MAQSLQNSQLMFWSLVLSKLWEWSTTADSLLLSKFQEHKTLAGSAKCKRTIALSRPAVQLLQIQEVYLVPHSNACNFCHFLSIFLVISRSSFTSRTPNKTQKIELLFYFLIVLFLWLGDIHKLVHAVCKRSGIVPCENHVTFLFTQTNSQDSSTIQ